MQVTGGIPLPMRLLKIAACALLLFCTGVVGHAQELEIGPLESNNDTGIKWLNFWCRQQGNTLGCDVFQTLIMHKVEPADWQEEVDKKITSDAETDFRNNFGSACKNIDQILSKITKTAETGVGPDGRKVNPRQAQDGKVYLDALAQVCKNTNRKTIRHFIEVMTDKDVRTCQVSNSYAHMSFNYDFPTQMWVSREGPQGPCGFIIVATLEKDKQNPSFWAYTERKLYTNPSANFEPLGPACSQFHDRTAHYTWQAADNFEDCTYLTNAPSAGVAESAPQRDVRR
jgi:hypothetical protein